MHGAERFKPEKPLLAQNQHGTANPDQHLKRWRFFSFSEKTSSYIFDWALRMAMKILYKEKHKFHFSPDLIFFGTHNSQQINYLR